MEGGDYKNTWPPMLQCHYEYFLEIYWPSVDTSGFPKGVAVRKKRK